MIDLESLWRDAKADAKVCTVTGTTKNTILSAIMDGARSFEAVAAAVPLCGDNECALRNPSGRGCRENVEALLSVYLPVYEMMTEDGGCHHHKPQPKAKPEGCSGTRSDSCGGCTGCGR
ncbi:MAG: hypothetical protein Q4D58_06675 [Synergistaceae bacterium]|nr:hypothetical protein [Synergistaceae bacterium]